MDFALPTHFHASVSIEVKATAADVSYRIARHLLGLLACPHAKARHEDTEGQSVRGERLEYPKCCNACAC